MKDEMRMSNGMRVRLRHHAGTINQSSLERRHVLPRMNSSVWNANLPIGS